MIYLYNWAGQPEKTQKWVREVMDRLYSSAPDGYCGDEDNGQTSAWYVFSALGFYPVCPGSGEYAVGTPLFERAVVHLENGKRLEINAEGLGPYIKDIKVDGGAHTSWFFDHDTLKDGVEISFIRTPETNI
jgi:putative alpha-1,2-mannosidase